MNACKVVKIKLNFEFSILETEMCDVLRQLCCLRVRVACNLSQENKIVEVYTKKKILEYFEHPLKC